MTAEELSRAEALLQKTAELLASLESEIDRLAEETEATRVRLAEWERQILALLPEEENADADGGVLQLHVVEDDAQPDPVVPRDI